MKRFDIIDGMRGYFLVFMVLNHLIFAGGYLLVKINHNQLAFVEDAQGFVFLSGLLIGMVYAKKMLKNGYAAGRTAIYNRAFELYRYAMGIVLVVLVAQMLLPGAYSIWFNWLGYTTFDDPLRLAAIATFLYQPTFMDILPQYIVYMLFAPMLVKLVLEDKWHYVVAGSVILWMAAQLGLQQIATTPLNDLVMGADDQGIRVSFNLLGWQVVFYSGLVLGALTSAGKIKWSNILSPDNTFIPKVALLMVLFFLPLRLITAHELMPPHMIGKFASMEIRADFGPVYLLNFAAVAMLVTWLIVAGPKHRDEWVRRIAGAVTWVFSIKYLQLLGRHSLYVYVWHVAIVYFVYYFDGRTPELNEFTKTAIALVSIALLSLPALWRERDKLFGTAEPAPVKVQQPAKPGAPQQMVIR
ncbi:OpgC family protein [Neorhizobium galegae]|uniref:OpgC protein n=2 Tax=Neorhizobium galegae TaxID=399 RepID=A0A068SZF1_NEOGA|nr:OpgC domain-containing protein [Neorhizobium galegae]CDN51191.1 OpgC protein [Neorhizobium galegae bv. orientalis str. HAMBI 540]CDN57376.1 OpgC protein [Neorhizobium galegae bv. officinalis bv. officinalis str. HAMBI 1141]